ncbi:MAG TPA: DUF1289 domain-containing protein [Rhizomicrobium sp.]|jgi:predicted Fe-S protein YdhL (DUF1289 family)|nr:DUF1289 domain-containing protein [Rhizomicrobium sp.]
METPCIKICVFDPISGRCSGCGRTLDEIADWANFSDAERRCIMAELPERMKELRMKNLRPD